MGSLLLAINKEAMSFGEAVGIGAFCFAVVIIVLCFLSLMVKGISYLFTSPKVKEFLDKVSSDYAKAKSQLLTKLNLKKNIKTEEDLAEVEPSISCDVETGGQIKLTDVDEPTAAMIMAIVCDEIGMSPNELIFKSIKLMNKEK